MAVQDTQQKAAEKAAYVDARLVYDKAWAAYVDAGGDREKARAALNDARVTLDKAWAACNRASTTWALTGQLGE